MQHLHSSVTFITTFLVVAVAAAAAAAVVVTQFEKSKSYFHPGPD